jgi:hypothetical protein
MLDIIYDDMQARCVIHGMHGTQLAPQSAKLPFIQQRYSIVFWISATTIEKLNQGFVKADSGMTLAGVCFGFLTPVGQH